MKFLIFNFLKNLVRGISHVLLYLVKGFSNQECIIAALIPVVHGTLNLML